MFLLYCGERRDWGMDCVQYFVFCTFLFWLHITGQHCTSMHIVAHYCTPLHTVERDEGWVVYLTQFPRHPQPRGDSGNDIYHAWGWSTDEDSDDLITMTSFWVASTDFRWEKIPKKPPHSSVTKFGQASRVSGKTGGGGVIRERVWHGWWWWCC